MGILNYLPEFKVIEINRSTGLVMGHILSQFVDGTTLTLTTKNDLKFIENGIIVGLSNDLTIENFDATKHAQPFVVFNEEINTFVKGLKYYAEVQDSNGDFYPRSLALYMGDTFTTNNYLGILENATAAKITDGVLVLQRYLDDDSIFTVKPATLPTGDLAARCTYIGIGTDRVDEWEITYNLNNGNIDGVTDDVVLTVNSNVLIKDGYTEELPVYTGYELKSTNWAYEAIGTTPAGNDMPVADDTVYADWSPVRYYINYILEEGVTNDIDNPTQYNIETSTITLGDAVKELATFDGWYADELFATPVITEIVLGSTGDITLYPKFI